MTREHLTEILSKHKLWLSGDPGGERACLSGADLRDANLRGVDLDYSCWSLWCGSLGVVVDKRIFAQLAYHLARLTVDDEECKAAQRVLAGLANQFRRVNECGRIEIGDEK